MGLEKKEAFFLRCAIAYATVVALFIVLWRVTGNDVFSLCAAFTPLPALMVLAWRAGLFQRGSSEA